MKIYEQTELDFKDVLVKPKRSFINSRSEVEITREYKFKWCPRKIIGTGVIVANMATVGTFEIAKHMIKNKMFCCLHKHYTLEDLVKELLKPGRDPRDELPAPILRTDVLEMKDLKPGMVLSGTVRNVIDFGVFVDIGVHQDGLVHISRVCNYKVRHPSEVVQVGDVVKVAVLEVDEKRKRISLTMKNIPKEA